MNIAEKYALECGLKIAKPFIDFAYLPICEDNIITIDTRCRYNDGTYDYFSDVVSLIAPFLKEKNIEIYQIASDENVKLAAKRCFIKINKKQEAYIISKSKLLIANQNYSLYLASALGIPSVGLYSLFESDTIKPIWNQHLQINIDSERYGNLPSYGQLNESPKTVNSISPYLVAKKILDALNIKNDLDRFELVHLGKEFNRKVVEIVPNYTTEEKFLQDQFVNLRLDYIESMSTDALKFWIKNRKVNIITDKDINLSLLAPYKQNVKNITIMISDRISENFLKNCKYLGFSIKIYCNQIDKINEFRFKFLDWDIFEDKASTLPDDVKSKINETTKFTSSKILFSSGKLFSSKASFLRNSPLDKLGEHVILSKEFEEEQDYFKIYNEREQESTSSTSVA
jgi:hypothetical protein